jgi:integrase
MPRTSAIQPCFLYAARDDKAADETFRQRTAVTRQELEAMLATCDDSLEGIRDRALLCFGFSSGGRRRSEIAAADFRDLKRTGPSAYIYRLEHSKTQLAGPSTTSTPDKPILNRSADALSAWLEAAGISEGAIFRRLWKNRVGPALSPRGCRGDRATAGAAGWARGGFRGTQHPLRFRHRSGPSRRSARGSHGHDGTPCSLERRRVLSGGVIRAESSLPSP